MKPIVKPKQFTSIDVYAAFALKLLAAHPDWWGKGEPKLKRKNCYIYAKEDNKIVLKMSWHLWKEITDSYFFKAKDAVVAGETFRLGNNLGKIRGARIERNFTKPKIDWFQTMSQKIPDPHNEGKFLKIFHTDEDYCKIEWKKFGMITNETSYNFQPAAKNCRNNKGFKFEFSSAIKKDPMLKYKFKYYPLNGYKKPNKDAIPVH
jgi:hypothetical protein